MRFRADLPSWHCALLLPVTGPSSGLSCGQPRSGRGRLGLARHARCSPWSRWVWRLFVGAASAEQCCLLAVGSRVPVCCAAVLLCVQVLVRTARRQPPSWSGMGPILACADTNAAVDNLVEGAHRQRAESCRFLPALLHQCAPISSCVACLLHASRSRAGLMSRGLRVVRLGQPAKVCVFLGGGIPAVLQRCLQFCGHRRGHWAPAAQRAEARCSRWRCMSAGAGQPAQADAGGAGGGDA